MKKGGGGKGGKRGKKGEREEIINDDPRSLIFLFFFSHD